MGSERLVNALEILFPEQIPISSVIMIHKPLGPREDATKGGSDFYIWAGCFNPECPKTGKKATRFLDCRELCDFDTTVMVTLNHFEIVDCVSSSFDSGEQKTPQPDEDGRKEEEKHRVCAAGSKLG
eukprot:gb/GECG01006458.1/.p1 GENE.gb/GECG01006458.1/~~gb/GECG01006458.1/.p1  ORF type:complete len:126 (+),score=10.15 gb/GECG01006458.1/:1-378(+)